MKLTQVKRTALQTIGMIVTVVMLAFVAQSVFAAPNTTVFHAHTVLVQTDLEPDVVMAPAALTRLSWGAIIAGSIMALIIGFVLNLMGIAAGASTVHPTDYGDSPKIETLATGAAVWYTVSALISLFIGGWMAAYFAGIPNTMDGILHGVMTWGVVSIVVLLFVTSNVGMMINGTASLLGRTLQMAASVTRGATSAAAAVAGAAANTAGSAINSAAQGLGYAVNDARYNAEMTAYNLQNQVNQNPQIQQVIGDVRGRVEGMINDQLDQMPEIRDAIENMDLSFESIQAQARQLIEEAMNRAGVRPDQVQSEARQAVGEVQGAVQQIAQDPAHWERYLNLALRRVMRRGQTMVNQADRDALVQFMIDRSGVSREQAMQQVQQWEGQFEQARQQVEQTRQQVEQRVNELRREAENRVEQARREAEQKMMQLRMEAEHKAREAAEATMQAVAKIAAIAFAALVVGAIAAGVGGALGTPASIETIEVTDQDSGAAFHGRF
ncbi:MAG: hypothetical protein MUF87_11610 [Anaerolineae bacterium]|jgi:vacuolar-type H+-ATPase subunit H|nr:hypothetical protein [Anaerolineae bacterium]